VQTKIKSEHGSCRVALQISSNPHNPSALSDLTIMMGVPDHVQGETLQTQPPGGVWDPSKSSVLWCVSELGSGEKFQLQARFNTTVAVGGLIAAAQLHFPVLVRCQCLQTQLSEITLVVKDNDVFPAELTTKVARRYRVSHREKNDS
jgi:Muniscin C-terminal mu homology domain